MPIAFNQIPIDILTPGVFVEFDSSRGVRGLSPVPHDVLIAGQMLATGSATAGQIVQVDSADDARILFGEGSQLALMIKAYKEIDSLSPCFACAVADASGTNAVGSFVWTGTATEDGELCLYMGGTRLAVAVRRGDSAATVETNALVAAALLTNMPVTFAANAAAGLDLTFKHDGTIGNQYMLGHSLMLGERVPAGLAVVVTAMASGATDPSYSGVITAIGEDQYHTIVIGLCTSTAVGLFVTELESRWGPMRQIEGQAFAGYYDARADLTTLGNAFNSFTFSLLGLEESALLDSPWENAAQYAALSAVQTQVDPARALTGLSFTGSAAHRGSRFTRAERNILLSDGVSTALAGSDGRLRMERAITTYQTNAQSVPDRAYQDVTTVRTLAALRYTLRNRIGTKFARFKLMSDGNPIPAGQPIVTPSIIRAEIIALFQDWQAQGWVENLDQFKRELLVERDANDPNRVNAILPPDLMNNLLVTAAQIAFIR